jgi:SAM-dependent methyltransferase
VTDHDASFWADPSYLLDVQYRTDANLAVRQSIYAYQWPSIDLPKVVLDLAALRGDETVADIGCGNGVYLAELSRRGHAGRMLGVDLSAGMLRSARSRVADVALAAGNAAALPLADGACDVALAMHMLYHLPDPAAAVRELRRVTRRGGRVLVSLNGSDHLRELRDLMTAALADIGLANLRPEPFERIDLERGQVLLSEVLPAVTRHDFVSGLLLPGNEPVVGYVRSTFLAQILPSPQRLVVAVTSRLSAEPGNTLRVRTHSGCLVCNTTDSNADSNSSSQTLTAATSDSA